MGLPTLHILDRGKNRSSVEAAGAEEDSGTWRWLSFIGYPNALFIVTCHIFPLDHQHLRINLQKGFTESFLLWYCFYCTVLCFTVFYIVKRPWKHCRAVLYKSIL